ncbi:zinc finger and BTB domain-containing protein 24 [Nilaparvata lugens]|uniref:zinc finger and BTB domain-containing protein 24 n=1 Tax=Nilaparvata lugens TaxID=108931 RepID=UPI00193E3857|nr:zinc finger and BTB domain-containing protein 24 [Nilaparvata lugens]
MSGYRRVNYYELCRLCTTSEGSKLDIFRSEGKKRQITTKIEACLSFPVHEDDSLPKNICSQCEEKLETAYNFREACLDARKMLTTFFSTIRFSDDFVKNNMVYIRDTSQNVSKEQPSEAEELPATRDSAMNSGKTTIIVNNHSQSPDINHVSSTTSRVAAASKKPVVNSIHNSYSFRDQMEAQGVTLSNDVSLGVPSQVVVVNSNYMGFNGANLLNGNVKRESPLNNNHVTLNKSQLTFQSSPELQLKEEIDEDVEQQLFYGRKKKKTLIEMTGSSMGDALQHDISYQHNQEFRLQLGLTNEDKESAANFITENVENRTSDAQLSEFAFFKLKTEPSMDDSLAEENGDLPDCGGAGRRGVEEEMSDREFGGGGGGGSSQELTGHMVGYEEGVGGGRLEEGEEGDEEVSPGGRRRPACEVCEVCSKRFRRKEHLLQHMKLHTGERPYSCAVCDKKFSRKEHLARHAVSHTGQKCHPCDICGKTFSRKDNLHKHKKIHGVAGPYVCEECGKSFLIKHYYLLHQSSHTAPAAADDTTLFKCDICEKVFATKQYLRSHKMRHERKMRQDEAVATKLATSTSNPPIAVLAPKLVTTSTSPPPVLSSEPPPLAPLTPNQPPPLTTINAQAILPSNLLHSQSSTNVASLSNPMLQVCNLTGKQTLIMSVASKQLMETLRKLNSS